MFVSGQVVIMIKLLVKHPSPQLICCELHSTFYFTLNVAFKDFLEIQEMVLVLVLKSSHDFVDLFSKHNHSRLGWSFSVQK